MLATQTRAVLLWIMVYTVALIILKAPDQGKGANDHMSHLSHL